MAVTVDLVVAVVGLDLIAVITLLVVPVGLGVAVGGLVRIVPQLLLVEMVVMAVVVAVYQILVGR
jgi:hypothetical protein